MTSVSGPSTLKDIPVLFDSPSLPAAKAVSSHLGVYLLAKPSESSSHWSSRASIPAPLLTAVRAISRSSQPLNSQKLLTCSSIDGSDMARDSGIFVSGWLRSLRREKLGAHQLYFGRWDRALALYIVDEAKLIDGRGAEYVGICSQKVERGATCHCGRYLDLATRATRTFQLSRMRTRVVTCRRQETSRETVPQAVSVSTYQLEVIT